MDSEQIQRFAEGYRQMPDEKLASLLAESESLTEEAEQALMDVIAERPDADNIRLQAHDHAQARRQLRFAGERPTLGFWLGFLTFSLCVASLRMGGATFLQIRMAENQVPQLLEMGTWQIYRFFSAGLCIAVLVAAIVAIHAIHAGRTHSHLLRIIAALWFMSLGTCLIDYVVSTALFGFEVALAGFIAAPFLIQFVTAIFFTSLWTAYLTRSERCRLRYPRAGEESVRRIFD